MSSKIQIVLYFFISAFICSTFVLISVSLWKTSGTYKVKDRYTNCTSTDYIQPSEKFLSSLNAQIKCASIRVSDYSQLIAPIQPWICDSLLNGVKFHCTNKITKGDVEVVFLHLSGEKYQPSITIKYSYDKYSCCPISIEGLCEYLVIDKEIVLEKMRQLKLIK